MLWFALCVFGHWLYVHEEGNVKKELERSTNHVIGLDWGLYWIGLGIGLDWIGDWIGLDWIGDCIGLDWWYQYWWYQ